MGESSETQTNKMQMNKATLMSTSRLVIVTGDTGSFNRNAELVCSKRRGDQQNDTEQTNEKKHLQSASTLPFIPVLSSRWPVCARVSHVLVRAHMYEVQICLCLLNVVWNVRHV